MARKGYFSEQDKINLSKGKRYSKDYQPSPEAKKAGHARAKQKNIVLNSILREITENLTKIKINGKFKNVTTLEALIKKMISLASKNDKDLIKIMNLLLEYESRNTAIEQRAEEFERKNATSEDDDFNDSFIEALKAQTADVWKED